MPVATALRPAGDAAQARGVFALNLDLDMMLHIVRADNDTIQAVAVGIGPRFAEMDVTVVDHGLDFANRHAGFTA